MKKAQKQKMRWGMKSSVIDGYIFDRFGVSFRQMGAIA